MSDLLRITTALAVELATTSQRHQIQHDLVELNLSRGQFMQQQPGILKPSPSEAPHRYVEMALPAAAPSVNQSCPGATPASAHNAEAAPSSLPGAHALCASTVYDRVNVFPKGRWT